MEQIKENTWTAEEVKRFWDYQSTIPENYFTYQIGDKLVDFFKNYIKEDIQILDYGAGAGVFTEQVLKKTNAKISSCDFSSESVEKENERCSQYPNFQGAYLVDELIKQNKKFDLIFCFEVIEHCNDHYLDLTFENFGRLLNTKGTVICSTPNNEDLKRSFIACSCCGKVFHRWQHERSWTQKTLKDYIEKNFFLS